MLRRSGGFTLIELMIGITLSLVVLGAVIAIFIPTLFTWQAATAQSYLQDTEQQLNDIFNHAVRSASAISCGSGAISVALPPSTSFAANATWATSFNPSVYSQSANNTTISSGITRLTDSGFTVGDMLVSLAPDQQEFRVVTPGTSSITVTPNSSGTGSVLANNYYLIHDCSAPTVVRATATSTSSLTIGSILGKAPPVNTVISGYTPTLFYLGTSGNVSTLMSIGLNQSAPNTFDLGAAAPIIGNVLNMRIIYHLHSPLPAGSTFTPPTLADGQICCTADQLSSANGTLTDVRALEMQFLLETPEIVSNSGESNYSFYGTNGKLYNCATTTFTMDNTNGACPAGLINRSMLHRTVSFLYDLPQ